MTVSKIHMLHSYYQKWKAEQIDEQHIAATIFC